MGELPIEQDLQTSRPFTVPLPGLEHKEKADDSDEWEYEYSTTETEVNSPVYILRCI